MHTDDSASVCSEKSCLMADQKLKMYSQGPWSEFGNVIEVDIFSPSNVVFLSSLWTDLEIFLSDL